MKKCPTLIYVHYRNKGTVLCAHSLLQCWRYDIPNIWKGNTTSENGEDNNFTMLITEGTQDK